MMTPEKQKKLLDEIRNSVKELQQELRTDGEISHTDKVLEYVKGERESQDAKWGQQDHTLTEWISILTEEVGEAAKEAVDVHFFISRSVGDTHAKTASMEELHKSAKTLDSLMVELVQVAAVAVATVECIERNRKHWLPT